MMRNAWFNVTPGLATRVSRQYASSRSPITGPNLTSSDLEPNFKLMASPGERTAVALSQTLQAYYSRLLEDLGPQGWWPACTRLEVVLAAVLTQNTSCENAAQALKSLPRARRLSLTCLRRTSQSELESLTTRCSTNIMRCWWRWGSAIANSKGPNARDVPWKSSCRAWERRERTGFRLYPL